MTTVRHCSFLLSFLTFLIREIFSFLTPNPSCPEHTTTNSGLFAFALAVLFRAQHRFQKTRESELFPWSTKQRVHGASDRQVESDGSDKPLLVFVPRGTFHNRVLEFVLRRTAKPTLRRLLSADARQVRAKHTVTREDLSETIR